MTRSPRLLVVFSSLLLSAPLSAEALFLRGNSNGDDKIDIADPIHSLGYLFLGGSPPDCLDAADSNDSGVLDISDPVFTLEYLFLGGDPPPPPGPDAPGADPTPDDTVCPGSGLSSLSRVELLDTDRNGAIDTAVLLMSEPIDASALPSPGSFSLVRESPGLPAEFSGGTHASVSGGDLLEVTFGSGLGRTDIQDLQVRIASPALVSPASGGPAVDLGPQTLTEASVGPTGTPVLIDKAPPVLLGASPVDTDGNGGLDRLEFQFSEVIQFRAGHGVAIGRVIDAPEALSVAAGATLSLSVDSSSSVTVAFPAARTGAEAIALDLGALFTRPPPQGFGEGAFTASFESGRYILRSGTPGASSSVHVTGGTAAALLGFDGSHTEAPGTDVPAPDLDDFIVLSSSGVDLLAGITDEDITIDGNRVLITVLGVEPGDSLEYYIADDFSESFLSDAAGNDLRVTTNLPGLPSDGSASGELIRLLDPVDLQNDAAVSFHPGVVPFQFRVSLISEADVEDVQVDLVSVTGAPQIDFLEPVELPNQGPAVDLFPSLRVRDLIYLVGISDDIEVQFRVTLTLDPATIPRQLAADSLGRISRVFRIEILNAAPLADLGPSTRVVAPGVTVVLDGSDSRDPNGDDLTTAGGSVFEWTIVSPSGERTTRRNSLPGFSSTELGAHQVELTVTDPGGAVSEAARGTIIVTGTGTSQVPSADAGVDRVRRVDTVVTLDGSASSDPDVAGLTFRWTQVSGPTATLSSGSAIKPTFTPGVPGTYVFELIVTDSIGLKPSAPDTVSVVVIDDQATTPRYVPAALARLDSSSTTGPRVLDELVVRGDLSVGAGTLSYQWSQLGGVPVIFQTTGDELSFRPVFPDTYVFELIVTDNTGLSSLPARIAVPVQPSGSEDRGNNVNWSFGADGKVTLTGSLTGSGGTPVPGTRFHFVPRLGPPVVLTDESPGRASFVPPHSGVYEFEVLAISPDGVTFTSEIEAPVSLPGNPLPTAVLEVTPGMTSIELDGSASTPTGLSHYFSQLDGVPVVLDPVGGSIVTFVPLIPGTYTFELVVVDSTRHLRSARARSFPVTLDTGAPDQPVLTGTTPSSPSSDETPEVHGTAEPGVTVEIHSGCGGPLLGSGIADPSGAFSITVTVPQNATTGLRAFAVDGAGNRSLCSSSFIAYVEDSMAPGAPGVTSTTPSSPSNDETPVVHGTAEPGATVQIRADCIGVVLGQGTADASGAFAIEVTVPENTPTVLRAFAIDPAGNPSTCSSSFVSYVEDSMAPAPPDVTGTSPPSPSNDETITVDGIAEPGSTVEVYSGAACVGPRLGSAVAGPFGAFVVSVTVPENATTRLQARAIDRAGNVSSCSSSFAIFTEDSIAPSAPVVTGTSLPSPSNDETIAVEGTAEPGSTVEVHSGVACAGPSLGSAVALASGAFSVSVTVPENATTRLQVRAVDAAGNVSSCSSSFVVFVEDSIPPAPPVLTGTTPRSPSSSTTFQVSGTGEALATVRLHVSAGCADPDSPIAAVSAAGTFSVMVTVAPDAVTTLRATLTDAAGNVSACSASFAVENDLPPSATLTPPGADLKGCIPIEYHLVDSTSDPCDVIVQWRLAGSPDFQRATLAIASSSGTPSEGVYGLTTSPGGTAHHFVWNSMADLGPKPEVDVTLRVTAVSRIDGADGGFATVSGIDIDNGLDLAMPLDLASTDPASVRVADMNRDGRLDLVTVNGSSSTVTVHLQSPPPLGFSAQPPVAVGLDPSSLAVADFNRDGMPDVAVANHGDSSVSVLLGDGTGHLAAGLPPLGPCPGVADVRAADLDRDGRVDLVTANQASGDASIFLQTAAGFGLPSTHATGAGAASLDIGDIDRDGRLDIVVANEIASTVSFLRQDPAAPGSFLPSTNTLGSGPRCVWVADLDDDGKLDLVTADLTANGVSVFRGRGDGTFDARSASSTGAGSLPVSVAAGDLNDDGLPDLAVAASGTGDLRVLIQQGGAAIAFEDPPIAQVTGAGPSSLAIADFDRDGRPDLVVANRASATLSVVRNTQEPQCEVSVDAGTSLDAGPSPESVAIGDFDRDGHLDLVVVDPAGSAVRLLDGAGNGVTFTGSTWPAGCAARSVVVVDLAADTTDDPVATCPSASAIHVLPMLPAGGFGPPVAHAVGSNPVSIAALDSNLDGIPDLAVANQGSNDVTVLLGDPAGGFAPAPGSPFAVSAGPVSVAAGDVNGDSIPDLLVACADAGAVVTLRGTAAGGFTAAGSSPVAGRPVSVAVGDVNGDGKADFSTANELAGTATLRLGNGAGAFADAAGSPFAVGGAPSSIAIADLDGDGLRDVVVAVVEAHHDRVLVFADDGAGFASASATRTGAGPSSIAVGDLNGDGRPDLAVGHTGTGGALVFRGKGDGSFASVHDFDASTGSRPVAIGDFDRDGKTDLVIADPDGDTVSRYLGDGRGGFGPPQTFASGDRPVSIAVGDVNRDGIPDLVVANSDSSTFTVHLASSTGAFAPALAFPTVAAPHTVALGDVDRDGMLDVAVSVPSARFVSVYRGNGAGAFLAPSHTAAGVQPRGLALGDLDRDGIPDLVVVDPAVSIVRVFKGDGTGAFVFLGTFGVGLDPASIALGDLDGDGRLDLAVTNRGSHEITVRLGDGLGGFGPSSSISTGNTPASISIADVTGDGKPDILAATDEGAITVHIQGGPGGYEPPVKIVAAVAVDGPGPLASGGTIKNNQGGCAIARFEHLGGPAIQRLAGVAAMVIPLGILAFLKRWEKRRRTCGPGSSTS